MANYTKEEVAAREASIRKQAKDRLKKMNKKERKEEYKADKAARKVYGESSKYIHKIIKNK